MFKFFIIIVFSAFSLFCQAADNMESSYIPKRQAVKNFIGHDPLRHCAYQTLIHSQRLFELDKKNPDKHNFVKVANGVWKDMRNRKLPVEEKEESLKAMLDAYFQYLPPNIRSLAEEHQLVKKPYWSWDRIENHYGWGVTTGLKYLLSTAIMCSFVVCPAAATIMSASAPLSSCSADNPHCLGDTSSSTPPTKVRGTFQGSCKNIVVSPYTPCDPNVQGPYISIKAECLQDRADYSYKSTHIVLPEQLYDCPSSYHVHNCNGTLVATEGPRFVLDPTFEGSVISSELTICPFVSIFPDKKAAMMKRHDEVRDINKLCPKLEGSYKNSCNQGWGRLYKSSDEEIPTGTLCSYQIYDCKDIEGDDVYDTTLYLQSNDVKCGQTQIENCNGIALVRRPGESDRTCEKLVSNRKNNTKCKSS